MRNAAASSRNWSGPFRRDRIPSMGIAATFSLLRTLPIETQLEFAEAALHEPYPELQAAGFDLLSDPAGLNRPEVILRHYPLLLAEVKKRIGERRDLFLSMARKELASSQDSRRRAALALWADLGGFEALPALVEGVLDPSGTVREAALEALERLALLYRHHREQGRRGDRAGREIVERYRPGLLRALRELLGIYSEKGKWIFVDLALGFGEEAFEAVNEAVPPRADSPLHQAFRQALMEAPGPEAAELLFRMFCDPASRLREMAREVMERRRDAVFGRSIAAWLGGLSPERRAELAGRVTEIPWWPAVQAVPDLEAPAAAGVLAVFSSAAIDPGRRDAMILHFLESPREEVRIRALEVLREVRSPRLAEAVRRALGDPSEAVQRVAARSVEVLDPSQRIPLLGPLLQSPLEELRRVAMREISRVGFDRYMAAFDRLSPSLRESAARALAKVDGAMLDRLAEEIHSLDPQRRLKALQVAGYVEAGRELQDLLRELLSDPDPRVRATAVKIVEVSGNVEGMRLLVGALGDPDDRVRANAVEAFEEIGDPRYAQLLIPFLSDPDNRVRANAAKALWVLGRREVKETLEGMLAAPEEEMRLSAAWAIGEMRYEGFVRVLEDRMKEEPSPRVRARLAEALRRSLGV